MNLTEELDRISALKKEYTRKIYHEEKMAKIEKNPNKTNQKIVKLRKDFLESIVNKL
ncbi:unknown [Choristoneura occidentalis granulovirus]|uniref:Uncharacterized protein n=1 Tax=Choristoneura occidentalis granulovirus TaxID=364745 RepID=Q1A4T0_9BBAC|nr:unknown [Choristoneura fumiferana granulovirus]ABC61150.1 unknown [Choristoneura fumiferana granulovirus]